jgi:hypothetical protein
MLHLHDLPSRQDRKAEVELKAEGMGTNPPSVEDDLRALKELEPLLHESVYDRAFGGRILAAMSHQALHLDDGEPGGGQK